ncbi:MAG: altronate hydrolase [Chromatiales bacterium]|jgi:altronate dehydratase|nr:altronate hydrolase [Chromatiales bacterium]
MNDVVAFDSLARLPSDDDNVAIATRQIEAGTSVALNGASFAISHTILEGHRFASQTIGDGTHLTSWGLPFGRASRMIAPGEYVCNERILAALEERHVPFDVPQAANFSDFMQRHEVNAQTFVPGEQVSLHDVPGTFEGFPRAGGRGVGTRNFVVILGTTSRAGPFAQAVADQFEDAPSRFKNIDGVVAVTHTEGGLERPNNLDFVLRTLAGFMVHPNVGAIIAIDYGTEGYTNDDLQAFMAEHHYPLGHVTHAFARVSGPLADEADRLSTLVDGWLPDVDAQERSAQPIGALKLALQCGGSDAFSGVSGNALAGWVAKEIIRHGGSANLAETDELIGAEPYMLSNVRDLATAERFLEKIDIFKERAANHGASAEGNPSGGNNYRGLYNIALKSIGAARKRDPQVRLDGVLDYGQPMEEPGYYFMDSPGNDLESIAGQVAAGSNLIAFITGNGSITNFPFVPTLKFVTTSGRFEMLANEMDVNAGRYNDGMAMDELGAETFDLAVSVASGERSKGELAGHAQVSIWRNWQQTESGQVDAVRNAPTPSGRPLAVMPAEPMDIRFDALEGPGGPASAQIGLIMPTSLCSGQVAKLIARDLNARSDDPSATRYVALVHTEGCGSANAEGLFLRTLLGHLRHPTTRQAVLLEHGCEKTHNDAVRNYLADNEEDINRFGWASVQLDGGLTSVSSKVSEWFENAEREGGAPNPIDGGTADLRIAITSQGPVDDATAILLADLVKGLHAGGACIVMADNASLGNKDAFVDALMAPGQTWEPTLAYGERPTTAGVYVMETANGDELETVTGLGATGAEIIINCAGSAPSPAHPMVATLQVSGQKAVIDRFGDDLDLAVNGQTSLAELASLLERTASRQYQPALKPRMSAGFQLARGPLGISM